MSLEDLFINKGGNVVTPRTPGRRRGSGVFRPQPFTTRVRPIPGEYPHPSGTMQQLYMKINHWNNKKRRSQYCTSRWTMTDEGKLERTPGSMCIGCHEALDESKRHVSVSSKYGMTVLVLENYHLSPLSWDDKTPLGVDDEGKQKYRKVLCSGDSCELCKRLQRELKRGKTEETADYRVTWGRKERWELSTNYLTTLKDYAGTHRHICANCGSAPDRKTGEGGIMIAGLSCPECGADVPVQNQKLARVITSGLTQCPHCKAQVKMEEQIICSDCADPRRATIFDMDLWLFRSGDRPNYALNIIESQVGPIDKEVYEALGEDADKPLPLEEIMEGPPIQAQCKLHGVPNPYRDGEDFQEYNG